MTEQEEEAVGRQRLAVLREHQARLISLETERDVDFPKGNSRHEQAVVAYDKHVALVGRFERDPFVAMVRILDAESRVTIAESRVTSATERLTEAAKALAAQQAAVDSATAEVTEARAALDALKTP